MSKHKDLVEGAKVAIDKMFSDTSVSRGGTKLSLLQLREHINDYLSELRDTDEDEECDE